MKTTKRSFLTSLVALLVLFSMFVGTTFAWFTDIAVSSGNVIQAGKLDISLKSGAPVFNDAGEVESWNWTNTEGKAIFNYDKWEPGYTTWAALAVENNGNLAAKISARISLNGNPTILGDVIDVYAYVADFEEFDPNARPDFTSKAWHSIGTVNEIFEGTTTVLEDRLLNPNVRARIIIALHMREDAGNEYQGLDLGSNFDITIMATQASKEPDSFDEKYDENAEWPFVPIKFNASESIADKIDPTNGGLTEPVTVGDEGGIKADVPADVTLAEGATSLTLSVNTMDAPTQDLDLEPGEVATSIDVHIDGVAEGNTTPMQITIPGLFSPGLNAGNTRMMHVENGQLVEMDCVDSLEELDAHNEFYYDSKTGDAIISIASFSEITPIENDYNPWNGKIDISWYNTTDDTFTLTTADELAGFGAIVDGGYNNKDNVTGKDEGWVTVTQDSFEKKTIKLGKDMNMNAVDEEGNRLSFNPIGYSYSYKNGQVFKGTFDGQNHTISNLYINGWELGLSYSMAGGGFFASVEDATIQNVTFSNAEIVMECIEQGVVTGLAQGNCTFENINIYGCSVANYQRATGGVVGEVNPYRDNTGKIDNTRVATHTFKNINIDSTTVIGSLWGDFDAPVGGVIGAKWDDDVNTADGQGVTQVVMENVNVACRLDVYNDVTSAYEWYSYRRAGMLIGNTEEVAEDGRTAKADFLKCTNVVVFYSSWVNYHYCQFENQTDAEGNSLWNNNYPWVRVEAGENCSAFSNPRYGQPVIGGAKIQDTQHTHDGDDQHLVELTFNQLYGGGQGVYGAENHYNANEDDVADVTFGKYTVTYMDHGEIIRVDYVSNNESKHTLWDCKEYSEDVSWWVDNNSNKITEVAAGNTADVIVYPKWNNEYVVRCIDTKGNAVYYDFIDDNTTNEGRETIAAKINTTLANIQSEVDDSKKVIVVKWKKADGTLVETVSASDLQNLSDDFILTATPELSEGSMTLEPVYNETTGELEAYKLTKVITDDSNINVVIPEYVGTVPVTTISDGAAGGFDNLHSIVIPTTVTEIGSASLSDAYKNGSGETITIYYEGSYDDWKKINFTSGWDDGLGAGSRIFFLNGGDTVDTEVYLERYATKDYYVYKEYAWKELTSFTAELKAEYDCYCQCTEVCKGDIYRADSIYWKNLVIE